MVEPVSGGLSNANYKVADRSRSYLVRVGADIPAHHVFRDKEAAISRAAHKAGVSPALVYSAPGIMVFDYVEARTFGAGDVRSRWREVADLVRRCHDEAGAGLAGPAPFFWVFHVIRDYAARLRDAGHWAVPELDRYVDLAAGLEAAQVPLPIVLGHHDLLPANILDDGERLWLVDWEYGGFGTALFDLANLAGNAEFSSDDVDALLAAYFGRAPDRDLRRAFDAMKVASLLREAMWGMVSELVLTAPGVDYRAYAELNLERFEAALAAFEDAYR